MPVIGLSELGGHLLVLRDLHDLSQLSGAGRYVAEKIHHHPGNFDFPLGWL
jgi:hypothetical protein